MIGTFARLKLRLLRNNARKPNQAVAMSLAGIFGLLGAVGGFLTLAAGGHLFDLAEAGDLAVVATGTVFFGWVLGSVFLVGVDESIDARRLSLLPLTRRELYTGLAAAGLIGIGPVAVVIGLSGLVVGYAPPSPAAVLVVAAAALAVVMPMAASRALATFLAGTMRHRWLKDVALVVGAVIPMVGYFVPTALGRVDADTVGAFGAAADVLRFTPGGFTGQVVASVAAGDHLVAAAALVGAAAWTAAFAWAWVWSLARLVDQPELASVGRSRPREMAAAEAFGWPGPTPTGAVRARELRYLVRAPNRRAVLFTFPLLVLALAASQLTIGARAGIFGAVAALVFLSASQLSNQLGYHGGALWMESAAAEDPRDLIVGRHAGWYLTAAAPVVLLVPVLGLVTGRWALTTLLLAGYLAVTPVLVAAGSIASVLAAYAVPEDANPFRNRDVSTGKGCTAGIVSLVVTVASCAAVAPAAGIVILAASMSYTLGFASLVLLAAYSWLLRTVLVSLAARRFAARHDELMERLCLARGA